MKNNDKNFVNGTFIYPVTISKKVINKLVKNHRFFAEKFKIICGSVDPR